jgi:drug/metabolite transporter (DMT)-like permease
VMSFVGAAPSTLAPPPDVAVWGAILLTSVAATALAFFIQTWAQSILDPTRAAIVLTTEPVFAAIFGVAVGGDRFTIRTAVGALCVLGAMLLIELGPRGAADATVEHLEA